MKNLNKIWGLIIVGVVMLVSCNTYDRSGVSDVGVPSGVTMESMYDDISSVLSEVAENDEELKRYEELFGGIDFRDGNAIELTEEQEAFIKNSTCYREMLGLLNKYFTEEDMLLVDGAKLERYRNGLRKSDYVLRTAMREMDAVTELKSEKWSISMLHAMKNFGYARSVGSYLLVRDSLGYDYIVKQSNYKDFKGNYCNKIPFYEYNVNVISDLNNEMLNKKGKVHLVDIDDYVEIVRQNYLFEDSSKVMKISKKGKDTKSEERKAAESDCQKEYDRSIDAAYVTFGLSVASYAVSRLAGTVAMTACMYQVIAAEVAYDDCMEKASHLLVLPQSKWVIVSKPIVTKTLLSF